jgi:hypothetical protein
MDSYSILYRHCNNYFFIPSATLYLENISDLQYSHKNRYIKIAYQIIEETAYNPYIEIHEDSGQNYDS